MTWLTRGTLRDRLSIVVLLLILLAAVFAPWLAPYSPYQQDLANSLLDPSLAHPLGTDDLGRDVLSRLLYGASITLYASFLAVGVACALGIPIGLLAGFLGGWVDEAIGRLIDSLLSFPAIVLAIAVTGALGVGMTDAMLAIGIAFSPMLARLASTQTLLVRHELYVDAARCFGAGLGRILLRHILPNAVQPLIVQSTLLLAAALLAESGLSFLAWGCRHRIQAGGPCWLEPMATWILRRGRPMRRGLRSWSRRWPSMVLANGCAACWTGGHGDHSTEDALGQSRWSMRAPNFRDLRPGASLSVRNRPMSCCCLE